MVEVLAGVAVHQLVADPLCPVFANAAGQVVESFEVAEVHVLLATGGRGVARERRRSSRGRGGRRRRRRRVRFT